MANPSEKRGAAHDKAQKHFTVAEQRAANFKDEVERERVARNSKTAKLRALRLAKEATDADEASKKAAEPKAPKRAPRKKAAPK